jgi:NTP pyrophosphatase (non-canonical NTP hydrolase)
MRDQIIKQVINKIKERSDVGYKKYGVTLHDDNQPLDSWLDNMQEELMDAINYIEKAKETMEENSVFTLIREWARQRGLYNKGDVKTQYIKLQEECGELAEAILDDDLNAIQDAIGDIVVVLTNLAHLNNLKIEHCITTAYNEIKDRKGKMINNTFVKNENSN